MTRPEAKKYVINFIRNGDPKRIPEVVDRYFKVFLKPPDVYKMVQEVFLK